MDQVFGRPMGLACVAVVVVVLLGSATPASSLLINTTSTSCSTQCESKNCLDPVDLRYGKYCGVGYTGCSGQQPCDGLDSCCQTHDNCIGSNLSNYLNRTCNDNLKTCVSNFGNGPQFTGANCSASEVEGVIIAVMDVATVGRGNPSALINLEWVIVCVFILSAMLLQD